MNEQLSGGLSDTHVVQKSEPLLLMRSVPFSLGELKVLDTYISRINARDDTKRTVTFSKAEYEDLMGLHRVDIRTLKKYTKSFLQKIVELPLESGGYEQFTLFTKTRVEQDEYKQWHITLCCSEEAKKFFFDIEKLSYLRYELKNILTLSSKHSYLLYLYVKREKYRRKWRVALNDLRDEKLDLKDSECYSDFKYFKRDVLDKAKNEINKKTDLRFEYTPIRTGRKTTHIEFRVPKRYIELPNQVESLPSLPEQSDIPADLLRYHTACEQAFTAEELTRLQILLETSQLPSRIIGDDMSVRRYNYVVQMYCKYKAVSKSATDNKKPIKKPFDYFYKMVENELNQLNKKSELVKTSRKEQSYDIDEFESLAITFSKNTKKK